VNSSSLESRAWRQTTIIGCLSEKLQAFQIFVDYLTGSFLNPNDQILTKTDQFFCP
jgi:hypothetical protein